jgi:hypothetical protein
MPTGLTGVRGFRPMASLTQELHNGMKTIDDNDLRSELFFSPLVTHLSPEHSDEDHDKYIMWWSSYETYPALNHHASLPDIHR